MKKPHTIPLFTTVVACTVLLASCGGTKWLTDFPAAQERAQAEQKNIFLLVSGDDWDGASVQLKKNVFSKKAFKKSIGTEYVLLNLDFSQTEYAKTDVDENASAKERQQAEKIRAEYEQKNQYVTTYRVERYPSLYVLSPEGYVLAAIAYDESMQTFAEFEPYFADQQDSIAFLDDLRAKMNAASGTLRVYAIDSFYEATNTNYQSVLHPLVQEVLQLDSKNETGLLGKYELINAYTEAIDKARTGEVNAALQVFTDVCETGHLNEEQKQEAYYNAAFVLVLSGSDDYDLMEQLLDKAYDAAPDGIHSAEVQAALTNIRMMLEALRENAAAEAQPSDWAE